MRSVFQTGTRFQDFVYAYSTCLLSNKQYSFYLFMPDKALYQWYRAKEHITLQTCHQPWISLLQLSTLLPSDHPRLPSLLSTRFHMSSPFYSPFCWPSTGLLVKRNSILEEWEMPSTCIYACFHTTLSYFPLHRENINDTCLRSHLPALALDASAIHTLYAWTVLAKYRTWY